MERGIWKSEGYPKKGIIDSQSDLNPNPLDKDWSAWPLLKDGKPLIDSNRDFIPDGWLEKNYPTEIKSDI
ncbi:hypothetical protein [Dysgonomonas sp.]